MFFETTRYAHDERTEQLPRVTLRWDSQWNDDGHRTKFAATFHAANGSALPLGDVKILQRNTPTTSPPSTFEELDTDFVSLGQSSDYYGALAGLGEVGREILHALQDVTLPPTDPSVLKLFGAAVDASLLRFPEANTLYRQAAGIAVSKQLEFDHRYKFKWFSAPHAISFAFDSDAPLGRIVALVGENASGKTSVLGRLAMALCGLAAENELKPMRPDISGVLALSFSAFDTFERPDHSERLYEYAGLRGKNDRVDVEWAFARLDERLEEVRDAGRFEEWTEALATCDVDATALLIDPLSKSVERLSSGQKFIVFIFTHLVARLRDRTVVLFDEPELHTHPRMLSAIMRALVRVLEIHDSYAILGTHSPIVLQELPARCVRILDVREGTISVSNYPGESFGALLDQIVRRGFRIGLDEPNFVKVAESFYENGREGVDALKGLLDEDISTSVRAILDEADEGPT